MEENNLILDLTTAVYRVMDKMQAAPSIDAIVKRLQQINLRSGLYRSESAGGGGTVGSGRKYRWGTARR